MLSLIELAKEEKLERTGAKPKLPIKVDGVSSETLDVYKIPLEYLYYNDKNGRIATGISQYQNELHPANDRENPQYNEFVAKLIEQDNPNALKRTRKSIEEVFPDYREKIITVYNGYNNHYHLQLDYQCIDSLFLLA